MVTLVSQISDYFEQFNSSFTTPDLNSAVSNSNPHSYFIFDFERYSDRIGTLHDLRTFMIERWQNSFFYAFAYLCFIMVRKN